MENATEFVKNMGTARAEQTLLGILIKWPERQSDAADVQQGDFSTRERQAIFAALNNLLREGSPIEAALLDAEVERISGASATEEIIECMQQAVSGHGAAEYARLVINGSVRRKGLSIARRLESRFMDPTTELPGLISAANDAMGNLHKRGQDADTSEHVMYRAYVMLDELYSGSMVPCHSGIGKLDRLTGGFMPGELTIIGARTGTGKSALALNIALASAAEGRRVCFVSTEMGREQLGMRLLANLSDVSGSILRNAREITPEQWEAMSAQLDAEVSPNVKFVFGKLNVEEVAAQLRTLRAKGECDLVIIDYIQQLTSQDEHYQKDWLRLGYVSRYVKAFCVEMNVPVIAMAQLNRASNQNEQPGLDSLRGSGDLEQDADNVILMSGISGRASRILMPDRQYLYDICAARGGRLMLLNVAKQRQGRTGKMAVGFDPEHMRYFEIEE